MPQEYRPYIQRFGVFISTPKLQLSMCSFEDDVTLSFASAFQSKNIERNFFRILREFGVPVAMIDDQFPEHIETEKRRKTFFQWFSFTCIAAAVIAVVINMIFTPSREWFPIVLGITMSMWVALSIGFFKRHNLLKNGIWQTVIFSVGCVLWDYFTGWRGWSLDYAFPAICLTVMASFGIITKLQKLRAQDYMIYYLLIGIIGLVPLLFWAVGLVDVHYLSVICGGVSFLLMAALVIFRGGDLAAELHKKLHF